MRAVSTTLRQRCDHAVSTLAPSYFALVMSSGIISIGLELEGHHAASWSLLVVAVVGYVVILALTLWRLVAHRRAFLADFADPARAFGFFTFVAATGVIGTRMGLAGHHAVTAVALAIGASAWLALGYVLPWTAVLGRRERPILAAANGTWFVWVVATQSVALGAATVEPVAGALREELSLVAVSTWSVGVLLYATTGILVVLRFMLYEFGPEDLTPPYWVAMGALAITVVAGSTVADIVDAAAVEATRELIISLTVVFWGFTTWLLPALAAAVWWRHVRIGIPLRYDPSLWSVVFPLGMYSVAGILLGRGAGLPIMEHIGAAELWIAVTAWGLVGMAMVRHLFRSVVLPTTGAAPSSA